MPSFIVANDLTKMETDHPISLPRDARMIAKTDHVSLAGINFNQLEKEASTAVFGEELNGVPGRQNTKSILKTFCKVGRIVVTHLKCNFGYITKFIA